MVAGHPPVRAQKLRYYEDRNFTERLVPPPILSDTTYADRPAPRGDDWTGRAVAVPEAPSPLPPGLGRGDGDGGLRRSTEPDECLGVAEARPPLGELGFPDEPCASGSHRVPPARAFTRTARLAALDPADGIPL